MEFIQKLKEVKKALSNDLDPKYILSTLQDFDVISQAEFNLINSKVCILLCIFSKKSFSFCSIFSFSI